MNFQVLPSSEDSIRSQIQQTSEVCPVETGLMELNLPELAFCLLSESNEGIDKIPLTTDGRSYVTHDGKYGLPTATARPMIMGLLALHWSTNRFEDSELTFEPRRLVEDFIQGKCRNGRASWEDVQRIERDLYRVAHSRIFYHRWWNKELEKYTTMDTSIIDFVEVIEHGSENEACKIRIGWGKQIFNNIKAGFVGTYHLPALVRLRGYIDKALFFFLSKHLYYKNDSFVVHSCQNFARFKLGMRGKRVERGGRTSSSYIVDKLQKSLERVNEAVETTLENDPGQKRLFAVRMTVDKSKDDYSIYFKRLPGVLNEVKVVDQTKELISHFADTFFGDRNDYQQKPKDRECALRWIDSYGVEKALWMIKRCKIIHKRTPRALKGVLSFKGLVFYEKDASSEYDSRKRADMKREKQLRLKELDEKWKTFLKSQIENYTRRMSSSELNELYEVSKNRARIIEEHAWRFGNENMQRGAVERSREAIIQERLGINKEEFRNSNGNCYS